MDVGSPYAFQKEESNVGGKVGRHQKQCYGMGYSLKYPVKGMECKTWEKERQLDNDPKLYPVEEEMSNVLNMFSKSNAITLDLFSVECWAFKTV